MTTETQGTVVLGFGPQELDWITKASKLCGKTAMMDVDVARMAGANLAAGTPEALDALRLRLSAGAVQAQRLQNPGLSMQATFWLASGERGLSSETIFQHLTGVKVIKDHWESRFPFTPSDPADLRRCRLLLEQVPELAPRIGEMATASPEWAGLVARWDEICAAMDKESPEWRNPTRHTVSKNTYALIKQATGR